MRWGVDGTGGREMNVPEVAGAFGLVDVGVCVCVDGRRAAASIMVANALLLVTLFR